MRRLALSLAALTLAACVAVPEGVQPVRGFDAARYTGLWHEVARLDHRFERGLVDVTAEYTPRADGGLDVKNRGWNCKKQKWKDAQGRAYLTGAPDVGQLKVSFFRPIYSGYNVIALDPQYRYAMVAGNDRSYLWILARERQLPAPQLQALLAQADALGFATRELIYPGTQADCGKQ